MTPFQRVAQMNSAFGNPKGNYQNIDWKRVRSQCKNIFDEYCELLSALGLHADELDDLKDSHEKYVKEFYFVNNEEPENVRDALADIQVFKDGALHMMGVDGDADMHAVVDGVMTRFIKNDIDLTLTYNIHNAKHKGNGGAGELQVYYEGQFPNMIMKSSLDQPDAPKGKFLKSASYKNTVFPEVV